MEYDITNFGGNRIDSIPVEYTKFNNSDEPSRIDEISDTLLYIGYTRASIADENAPIWKIKRVSKIGSIWTIAYATGTDLYSNIWTNRLTITYN